MSENENMQSESQLDPQAESQQVQPRQRRVRRASRYQRVQERKAQQQASDQRFYNAMFSLMGVLALFAVLLGAIMINGVPNGVAGMQGWTTPWIMGFTKLEIAGFAFVAFIALAVGLRMRRKR